jgi:prepilin-type N-terminal cleavage/methylation domain-containing protein
MHKQRGFTLVELLVVIAIIALLMSILMPALTRVRKQAKAAIDQARLKQWGLVFSMYTGQNDSYFHQGWSSSGGRLWMDVMRSYYQEEKMRVCPMATKAWTEGAQGALSAWGVFGPLYSGPWSSKTLDDYGSYGINGWLTNPPQKDDIVHGRSTKKNWRRADVKGAGNIPMFLDSWWHEGWPEHFDMPPDWDWQVTDSLENTMRRFCINRHDGFINCVFLDSSVRKVGLKELWKLKWNRKFNLKEGPVEWPLWMKNFKDY